MFARVQMLMMNPHQRRLVVLALLGCCLLPLMTGGSASRVDESLFYSPWPVLLTSDPAAVAPETAMLQLRANVTLARLVEAGRAAD